jgi:large subunit ribosomal protein L13
MKTYLLTKDEIQKKSQWFLIDASDQAPGKIAAEAARRLIGKHRPDFTPHMDLGDGVVVINAAKLRLTGSKSKNKLYRRHSGYKGNLKEVSAGTLLTSKPEKIIELSVRGMLPKNKLRQIRLKRLKIYSQAEYKEIAQKPQTIKIN